ncbi:hypothetical protein ACQ4PT_031617 [Festuca glaucescens]
MAAADYDRAYRPYAPPPSSSAADYDRPYRNEIVPYGDRRIDLVVKPPPARSPPPPLPVTKSGGGGGIGSAWCFSDPEVKRRRRVASYKAYSVEGKVKASFRRGFRWIKDKCTGFIHACKGISSGSGWTRFALVSTRTGGQGKPAGFRQQMGG